MVYGWNTKKTAAGYEWQVTSFAYGVGTKVVHTGNCPTRARAVRQAKRHVLPLRRSAGR